MVSVLRGISIALLVTIVTLLAGLAWSSMALSEISMASLVDIGLIASCLIGGYWTGRESGQWMLGGITGLGYVGVGTLLLALFLPISGIGFVQVLIEGGILGTVAGAFGAGRLSSKIKGRPVNARSWEMATNSFYNPQFADREDWEDREQRWLDSKNSRAYDFEWLEPKREEITIEENNIKPSYKWWEEELSQGARK